VQSRSIGLQNFEKEILLEASSSEEMFEKEREMVELGPHSYNLKEGGFGGFDHLNSENVTNVTHTNEHMKMMSARFLEMLKDHEWSMKFSESLSRSKKGKSTWNKGLKLSSKIRSHLAAIQHQQGEKNSQFGTMWITDDRVNRKIKKTDPIPEGWKRGRKIL
jgi:hypothetical protein